VGPPRKKKCRCTRVHRGHALSASGVGAQPEHGISAFRLRWGASPAYCSWSMDLLDHARSMLAGSKRSADACAGGGCQDDRHRRWHDGLLYRVFLAAAASVLSRHRHALTSSSMVGFPETLPLYVSLWVYVSLAPALLINRRELVFLRTGGMRCSPRSPGHFFVWPTTVPRTDVAWFPQAFRFGFLKTVDAAVTPAFVATWRLPFFTAIWLGACCGRWALGPPCGSSNWLWAWYPVFDDGHRSTSRSMSSPERCSE